ncbi:MAG: DUF222 domain-containing protein [Acidimicrobiia bacterium]|nr:DUF222 domain-containing protein [Acidimicrobiia bacterium]
MCMVKHKSNGLSAHRVRLVLPSASVKDATSEELEERMRSASRAESQAQAVRVEAAAELVLRRGQSLTEKTVRSQSGQSTGKSRKEVETAGKLKDLPVTSDAFRKGKITFDHARIIADTAGRVEIDEEELVDKATSEPVDVFARTARQHEQEQSEDDGMSTLKKQRRSRNAWIRINRRDGMTVLHAEFDPVTGERVKTALAAKTRELWREEDRDHRPSTEQRMADALADLICRPGERKKAPVTTLFLIADYDIGLGQIRNARLGDGTPMPVEVFKDLACRAHILPAIFNSRGQPLWVGLGRRSATPAQRIALIARDRGCVGCGADPAWCQAHHIVHWAAEGPTDIDNLVLLCSRCHHRVHDEDWEVQQATQGEYVLQPPSPDNRRPLPIRTPRRRRRKSTTKLLR